ncbi:hypothetical protein [Streptomyces hygroscopicus]|uniref:hypothetical protein n=1 Tax=Streptomyces hygroscopicus TaxID=1912 RepID=UPI00223FCE26|nr:hypothetical protein [Streptomyces hygroscopicus]
MTVDVPGFGSVNIGKRLHNLLRPASRAGEREAQALQQAGIPLMQRPGGRGIDPSVPQARHFSDMTNAVAIRCLYGLDGTPGKARCGVLPAPSVTVDVPGHGRVNIGQRLNDLLRPASKVGNGEAQALQQAGIPLVQRPEGGWRIDPSVPRTRQISAESTDTINAMAIRCLYGLDGTPAGESRGVLPAARVTVHVPGHGTVNIGGRLHNLLKPQRKAGEGEAQALWEAGIPLVQRPEGGWNIAPSVRRTREAHQQPTSSLSQAIAPTTLALS